MNILLNWKWRGPEMIEALEKGGHTVPYHVGITKKENHKGVFHDKRKAQRAIPFEEGDLKEVFPPGKDLIEKLYKTESLVLTMMNRRESELTTDERRHIYYWHVGYWSYVLDKYKIDAIVFDDVPHATNTFVMYSLAKLKGIKTIMFQKIRISDRFLAFTDWEKGSVELSDKVALYENKNFSIEELGEDVRGVIDVDTSKKDENPKPLYPKIFPNQSKSLLQKIFIKIKIYTNIIKEGHLRGAIEEKYKTWKRKKTVVNLVAEYNSLTKKPDLEISFIYVPLHYQPERTTCPQGKVYVDQILMIETLSAALPKGWKIYVKEHPDQWHPSRIQSVPFVRYQDYYQNLSKIPNVELIPVDTEFFAPIQKSKAVATITGSAGLEAILHLKPVLVFGLPWWKDFRDLFRVNSVMEVREAIEQIQNGFSVSRQSLINFIKAFEEVSVHGYINFKSFLGSGSKLEEKDSMNQMATKILIELAK